MLTRKARSDTILLAATMNYDSHKKSFECTFENNKCSLFYHRANAGDDGTVVGPTVAK